MNNIKNIFDKIIVDGTEIDLQTLENNGGKLNVNRQKDVTVEYYLKDNTIIPSNLFNELNQLKKVYFTEEVDKINEKSFYNDINLSYINTLKYISYIGPQAFSYTRLTYVDGATKPIIVANNAWSYISTLTTEFKNQLLGKYSYLDFGLNENIPSGDNSGTDPIEPEPENPVNPEPENPVNPEPETPVNPEPEDPIDINSEYDTDENGNISIINPNNSGTDQEPVNPEPGTDPVNPDPGTDPVNPDPGTDPIEPEPGTDPGTNPESEEIAKIISFDGQSSDPEFIVTSLGDGKITYDNIYYKKGVKINSTGSITFTSDDDYYMTIILSLSKTGRNININGQRYDVGGTESSPAENYYKMNPIRIDKNVEYTITKGASESTLMLIILTKI